MAANKWQHRVETDVRSTAVILANDTYEKIWILKLEYLTQ